MLLKTLLFCQLNIRHKDIFSSQKLLENYEGAALNAKVGLQNSQVENGMDYGVSVEVPGNSTKDYNYEYEYITDTTQLFNHCKGQQQWKRYPLPPTLFSYDLYMTFSSSGRSSNRQPA